MITLYRIAPEQYLENYSGRGASYTHGARWNPPGSPIIYFATSPAVAMLEMSHYIPNPRLVPKGTKMGVYKLDSNLVEMFDAKTLPQGWDDFPPGTATQRIGGTFLRVNINAALLVPSVCDQTGESLNALVNPLHPHILVERKLQLVRVFDKIYNDRTFQGI